MSRAHQIAGAILLAGSSPAFLAAQSHPTLAQFLSPASPLEVRSARRADRLAWITYERGMRNVYTAAAPDFKPVRLTRFLEDDCVDVTDVNISDDGGIVVFVRGSAPNRVGWVANPSHDPNGGERAIWAARTSGTGAAWKVVAGGAPALSPDGRWVLFVKDSQIYRARVTPVAGENAMDKGETPFIREWGQQTNPRWSPDGSRIAFVSTRTDHSFIGMYDVRNRSVTFVAPSVDFDGAPAWSADGKQLVFVRRPGLAFGQQAAIAGATNGGAAGRGGRGNGGGGGAGRAGAPADTTRPPQSPGLYQAKFRGGYTIAVMVADVGT